LKTPSLLRNGNELLDRQAIKMVFGIRPKNERRQHHFLRIDLITVLT
jgi:hypothetical protein